jgi:hypothetical protein
VDSRARTPNIARFIFLDPAAQDFYVEREHPLPDILDGRIEPGRVFDRTVGPDEVPDGYGAMAGREAPEVLIQP